MFGLSLTGEESVAEARENADGPATLTRDIMNIADAEGLAFDDDDVHYAVIYDTTWNGAEMPIDDKTEMVLTDFITAERGNAPYNPFMVNNEFQPTIEARTEALTVFRVVCVSASNLCNFMVLEGDGNTTDATIIPFDIVASDGISYTNPVYRKPNGNPLIPDITATEAYLAMGGGMREVVVVQFPRAGKYTIWQRSTAFDDGVEQLLMTVNVIGDDAERKSIESYSLASARPPIPEDRPIDEYRGLSFGTEYNQEVFPFPYYGIGDVNGDDTEAYNLTTYDIGPIGGTCGIWVLRTLDGMLHPCKSITDVTALLSCSHIHI